MILETIVRGQCCICGSKELVKYENLNNIPIFMDATTEDRSADLSANQEWVTCSDCGLLQLQKLIPLQYLYGNSHQHEIVGETWNSHHREFAKFIAVTARGAILEVGGAHGELAKNLFQYGLVQSYTVVEPHPGEYPEKTVVIKDYIENQINLLSKQDAVVHSHLIEHLFEPASFMKLAADERKVGSKMFISFPNIEEMLKLSGSNALNFEHTYFLTPENLEYMAKSNSLSLVRFERFRSHSFFWELEKVAPISASIPMVFQDKKALFDETLFRLRNFVAKTNELISQEEIPTYLYGAHIFSQSLISLGLESSSILGILDNAKSKQGKRLYGTDLFIKDPTEISHLGRVRIVLQASHYQKEIRSQLIEINPLAEIVE